jgi:glycosyltransferase involved in cell wall biosynthesis
MKKLLIICDIFPPEFGPRMGYLVKYLKKYDYESIVLSTNLLSRGDSANFEHLKSFPKEVYFLSIDEKEKEAYLKSQKIGLKKINHFFKPDLNRPIGLTEKLLIKGHEIMNEHKVDVILTSTSLIFPMEVGYSLSRTYKIHWVADISDIREQNPKIKLTIRERQVNLRIILRRNYLIKNADFVTTVSNHHMKLLSHANPKTKVIFNGYDPELFINVSSQKKSKFLIINIGHLTPDAKHSNPLNLLFRSVRDLINQGIIENDNFKICFFTTDLSRDYILEVTKIFNLSDYVEINGFVPADQIPSILSESSVLLLITSRSGKDGPKGILTTELFEYIGIGKPILCVESDRDEIAKIINSLNRGLAAIDEREIFDFLKEKFIEWKEKGFTTIPPISQGEIEIYSREYQAKQFSLIFDTLI